MCEQRAAEPGLALEVADHGFLTGVEAAVPFGSHVADGIAVGGLEAYDPGAQAEQLPARERAREVACEVDDERSGEGRHGRRKLPGAPTRKRGRGIPPTR